MSLLGLALNVAIFATALRLGTPHYLVARLVATAAVTVVDFQLYRRWSFVEWPAPI